MNNLVRFTVSFFNDKRVRAGNLLVSCMVVCLLSCVTSPTWANPRIGWEKTDSTSIQRAERDIADLKDHVQLSKSQEDYIYNMFLGKYQYLEQFGASGQRWELRMKTGRRKLRELLGEEAYLRADQAGLVSRWFGNDEN